MLHAHTASTASTCNLLFLTKQYYQQMNKLAVDNLFNQKL